MGCRVKWLCSCWPRMHAFPASRCEWADAGCATPSWIRMKSTVSLLLAAALVLSGLPHMFCACGASSGCQTRIVDGGSTCPGCSPAKSEKPIKDSEPCECPCCNVGRGVAIPASPLGAALVPVVGWYEDDVTPIIWVAEPHQVTVAVLGHDLRPPAISNRPSAALPILLGHLLI